MTFEPTKRDWNNDRLQSVVAILHNVENDIYLVTRRGEINQNIKDRMIDFLEKAAEEIRNTVVER